MTDERPIPLVDLGRAYRDLHEAARDAFERVALASQFTFGDDLKCFEADFAAYCGAAHCVGTSDGTEALRLALLAIGAGPGREVVTVPNTFVATAEAIALTGARPVFVDVDHATRCMDPAALDGALGDATAAVVPVHLYGRPAPMAAIRRICDERRIPVLEDAAQAHGARLDGKRAGALGTAAAFSFYPTKNLGALGDGGAVVTSDDELAETVRSLRHHGSVPGDANRHIRIGSTSRLDTLQAAFLALKLPHLDAWNGERRELAARYRERLEGLPLDLPPADPAGGDQVFHLFVVEVDDRDRVLAALRDRGVGAAAHYPTPIHLQPGWSGLGYARGDFPAAEANAARALTLPIFPGLTAEEVDRVAAALRETLAG